MPVSTLIVGYGNPLRGDDGVGQRVAQSCAARWHDLVDAVWVHQLTPELSEQMAQYDQVVFVDAALNAMVAEVTLTQVQPSSELEGVGHTGSPAYLLALAQALYGHCPRAWWVLIPVDNMDLGEQLTPRAMQGHDKALQLIEQLLAVDRGEQTCTR